MVKRLRHRPFTAVSGVRIPVGSPIFIYSVGNCTGVSDRTMFLHIKEGNKWAHSSVGRAPALQAGGHRFEPCCSHHKIHN